VGHRNGAQDAAVWTGGEERSKGNDPSDPVGTEWQIERERDGDRMNVLVGESDGVYMCVCVYIYI